MPKRLSIPGRWAEKVTFAGPDDCWLWTASKDRNGYGRFQYPTADGQRHIRAHQWAYQHFVGPIPSDMVVMHSCDVPACVNPAHLSIGTSLDNNADKVAKDRHAKLWGTPLVNARKTHCKRGHLLDGDNLTIVNGQRRCKTCQAWRARVRYRRLNGLPGDGQARGGDAT